MKSAHSSFEYLLIACIIAILLPNCTAKKLTAEETVRQFETLISNGGCEEAMSLCDEGGKEHIQALIDAGCSKYNITIDSIHCQEKDTLAKCICYETREGFSLPVYHKLVKVNGEWKITYLMKDEIDESWLR